MTPDDWAKAREQAQANANYFGRAYMVYIDTSGNVRVSRDNQNASHEKEVILPHPLRKPKTVGDAWDRIDEISAAQGKPQPKTQAQVEALGAEAAELLRGIDAAHDRIALRGIRGNL